MTGRVDSVWGFYVFGGWVPGADGFTGFLASWSKIPVRNFRICLDHVYTALGDPFADYAPAGGQ